ADVQEVYTGKFETSAVNCKVNLSATDLSSEEKGYRDLPTYYDFAGCKDEILRENFMRINSEVDAIVEIFRKPTPQVQVLPKGSMTPKK
ncbi:type IV secretory system conjugative DNA transfer family protein, partial [Mucilaginibacter sp. 5B2]|nr:type IV secretory system conjugative DNA transfer family protein [Mucilaginibacter sp. 5B2]